MRVSLSSTTYSKRDLTLSPFFIHIYIHHTKTVSTMAAADGRAGGGLHCAAVL